ncbi:TPA: hypothetical protein ACOBSY_003052 [Enterococcus faecium]|nr:MULTISPECIES: hypothetical protein [Enterococcus]EJY14371.1 hypothetical protein HMPREF1359_00851 [Enterococcus faecium E417]MEB4607807.1 hypothetical protein [Enterococcus sp. E4-185]EPI13837.1 hypothetical protein D357_00076 [Enterococcus faecium SD3B-2]EPI16717.1 hypothetical protein D355_01178 [Enterococcus faecium SD1C-2]MBK4750942.1 hypothetical protein [Enterococcus faecium]
MHLHRISALAVQIGRYHHSETRAVMVTRCCLLALVIAAANA